MPCFASLLPLNESKFLWRPVDRLFLSTLGVLAFAVDLVRDVLSKLSELGDHEVLHVTLDGIDLRLKLLIQFIDLVKGVFLLDFLLGDDLGDKEKLVGVRVRGSVTEESVLHNRHLNCLLSVAVLNGLVVDNRKLVTNDSNE